ncbi:MAG: sigma-E processing peptidase SpoIIGA [Firmicutes bacterium]|nr:sigma-E processing peptidase SpoIIGA [Bacillota bacterium]
MGVYTVYADVLLALNFFLDFFLLWATGRFLRRDARVWRLLAASLLGAVYGAAMLIPWLAWLYTLPAAVLVSLILLLLAFGYGSRRSFLKLFAGFYLVAFAMAGSALAGAYFLEQRGFRFGLPQTMASGALLFGLAVAVILARRGVVLLRSKWNREDFHTMVEVWVAGRSCRFPALIDTGNDLREPISGLPVVVADYQSLFPLFPESLRNLYARCGEDAIELLKGMENSSQAGGWSQRLRLVPFSSVGRKYGMLPGFRADRVVITEAGQKHLVQAVICIGSKGFCGGQAYRAVLNPELLAAAEQIREVSA